MVFSLDEVSTFLIGGESGMCVLVRYVLPGEDCVLERVRCLCVLVRVRRCMCMCPGEVT